MKRAIAGAIYDTDTAMELAGGDHGSDESQAWWRLYQTPRGAYFEVVAGHDGVVEEFRPLSRAQAYAFVETYANHLLEKYFGPLPEGSLSRFSRGTVIAAIEVLEHYVTQAGLTRLLLKLDPELNRKCNDGSVAHRCNHLIKAFDADPIFYVEDGRLLADALVEEAVEEIRAHKKPSWVRHEPLPVITAFGNSLDRDGFAIDDGTLRRTLPGMMRLPKVDDQIVSLLKKHEFNVPLGHLKQAFDNHTNKNWAAANSQIRSFIEGLLDEMTVRVDPSSSSVPTGQARRAKLASLGFLSKPLNEWEDNSKGYVNGLMLRLHPHGSHPGLSDQDDSTFRMHTVLLVARLLLLRFDNMSAP